MVDSPVSCYHVQVIRQFEAAKVAKGPVRDHRPLCLNLDDHIRVCSVVKAKASNYRSFPGVVTHPGPSRVPYRFLSPNHPPPPPLPTPTAVPAPYKRVR